MANEKPIYHASLEGAQHGDKDLKALLEFAKAHGCKGAQPSNYHLLGPDGSLMSAEQIQEIVAGVGGMRLDGISAHCWFWAHTSAWTGTKGIRPFLPEEIWKGDVAKIEDYCQTQILELLVLSKKLGLMTMPMFWGLAYGLEVASGYPWGFLAGPEFDYIAEGDERFVTLTAAIRNKARELGISLAHEIHPGTAAVCGVDFLHLVEICNNDVCLGVNADPSHCWEGEDFQTRFDMVGERVTGCHVKNFTIVEGRPLRMMSGDWKQRAMAFSRLHEGDLDLARYAQQMYDIGYAARYCKAHGTDTAPLVGEAESGYYALDAVAGAACEYIAEELCIPMAEGSFEDNMGE